MGLLNRLFGGNSETYDVGEEWDGYNISYSDEMPNTGVHYSPPTGTMRLVIGMSKATDEKVRHVLDSLTDVDIDEITINGVDENGEPVEFTIESGPTDDPDGDA